MQKLALKHFNLNIPGCHFIGQIHCEMDMIVHFFGGGGGGAL